MDNIKNGGVETLGKDGTSFLNILNGISAFIHARNQQRVGNIIFVDVADVLNCFPPDDLRGRIFNVPEPDVWIEAHGLRLLAKLPQVSGADIGRLAEFMKSKQAADAMEYDGVLPETLVILAQS
ncbi:hypothetical protein FHT86_007078 [Rhizobium sp. BK313]|uniref:hypothetical protein n=1 Tax=Rhizobium sp. BK313 TaxID=2587081 RepID=UPI0010E58B2E|nr:hypothetical protein [Rhizobium sp. BK313]MBB3458752.1 hypothetical protein [Rhizobium sp. BK313]